MKIALTGRIIYLESGRQNADYMQATARNTVSPHDTEKATDSGIDLRLPQSSILTDEGRAEFAGIVKHNVYFLITEYISRMESDPERLKMLMEYPSRQGHYRRPLMCVTTALALGAEPARELYLLAAALQLAEDFILMLDDRQDGSATRRGKKTFDKLYGVSNTENVAMMLQIVMQDMMHDALKGLDRGRADAIWEKFKDVANLTFAGQTEENNFSEFSKDLSSIDCRLPYRVAMNKTAAYTVYGPLQFGAIYAGKDGEINYALERVGKPIGVAFQLMDDANDIKNKRYDDIRNSKPTLMMIRANQMATAGERAMLRTIWQKEDKTAEEMDYVLDLLRKYDAIKFSDDIAERFAHMAEMKFMENKHLIPTNDYAYMLMKVLREQYRKEVKSGDS
jgi:geranylgeranyl pyrophosphate synthase